MKKILLLIISLYTLMMATPMDVVYKQGLYNAINSHVQKENEIYNYLKLYIASNFDNNVTEAKIATYFSLPVTYFNNYAGESNAIDINVSNPATILKNSLSTNFGAVPLEVKKIYYNNSYEAINSYTIDSDRYYNNDDTFYHMIQLDKHIATHSYTRFVSKTEPVAPTLPEDKLWLKPNGINGVDVYVYDTPTTKWVFNGVIAWNKHNPNELSFVDNTLFNPLTFPGVLNMRTIVGTGASVKTYLFNGTQWIEKKDYSGNASSVSNGYSNILDLVTTLLNVPADSTRTIESSIFYNDSHSVKKINNDLATSYWESDTTILSNTFALASTNLKVTTDYLYFAKTDQSDYIPMVKKFSEWNYISKTNSYEGVLEYPYNTNTNAQSTNTGVSTALTHHLITSFDTFDKQSLRKESEKQYFAYNDANKVFTSVKNSDGTANTTIQISEKRTNFTTLSTTNVYYSKEAECATTTNLGDSMCHDNGMFGGDIKDNLYKWYVSGGLFYDAHQTFSYNDMYGERNSKNNYFPLVIYNNDLYDLVEDSNDNVCYQNRTDNKYYTNTGIVLKDYDTSGKATLPIGMTCENFKMKNGMFEFDTLYDMVTLYPDAPDNAQVYIKENDEIYTKHNDGVSKNYWESVNEKTIIANFRDEITLSIDDNYNYLTINLGISSNIDDTNKDYRYTDTGIIYDNTNNETVYEWNKISTPKSVNTLIDSASFANLGAAYDDGKSEVVYIVEDGKTYTKVDDNGIFCYKDSIGDYYTRNKVKIPQGKNGYANNNSLINNTYNYCIEYVEKSDGYSQGVIYSNLLTEAIVSTPVSTTKNVETYPGYVVESANRVFEQNCARIESCVNGYRDDAQCYNDIITIANTNYYSAPVPNGLVKNLNVYLVSDFNYGTTPANEYWPRPSTCSGGILYGGKWYIPINVFSYGRYTVDYELEITGTVCPATVDFFESGGKCYHKITTVTNELTCTTPLFVANTTTNLCERTQECQNIVCAIDSNYWNNYWTNTISDVYSHCYEDSIINNACERENFYNVPKK